MPERLYYYIIYNKNCRCSRCGGGGRTRGDLCIFYRYLLSRKTFPGTDSLRAFHSSTPSPTTCLHNISRPRLLPQLIPHSPTISITNSLPHFYVVFLRLRIRPRRVFEYKGTKNAGFCFSFKRYSKHRHD